MKFQGSLIYNKMHYNGDVVDSKKKPKTHKTQSGGQFKVKDDFGNIRPDYRRSDMFSEVEVGDYIVKCLQYYKVIGIENDWIEVAPILKPCPFCGKNEPKIFVDKDDSCFDLTFCGFCGARGPTDGVMCWECRDVLNPSKDINNEND